MECYVTVKKWGQSLWGEGFPGHTATWKRQLPLCTATFMEEEMAYMKIYVSAHWNKRNTPETKEIG